MDYCHDVETIDCELSVYRKGFLRVRLDLIKGLIIWKDSNHWSNNFVRSMTFQETEQIKRLLPDLCSGSLECICPLYKSDSQSVLQDLSINGESTRPAPDIRPVGWQILLNKQEECRCLRGYDINEKVWRLIVKAIEQISRLPVRL